MAKLINDAELLTLADMLESLEALPLPARRRVMTLLWSRVFAEADPPTPPAVGCRHPPFVPQGES